MLALETQSAKHIIYSLFFPQWNSRVWTWTQAYIHHLQTYRAWKEMKVVYIYVNVKQGIKRKYLLLRRSNSKNIFICVCAVGEHCADIMCVRCNNGIRMVHEGRTGDCSSLWRYYLTQHVSNAGKESCKNGLPLQKKKKNEINKIMP